VAPDHGTRRCQAVRGLGVHGAGNLGKAGHRRVLARRNHGLHQRGLVDVGEAHLLHRVQVVEPAPILLARNLKDNDTLGVYLKAAGPEFEPGVRYQVELIFPRVSVLATTVKVYQRRLSEEVEFAVLEDDTYGSVVAYVQNQVSSYAA